MKAKEVQSFKEDRSSQYIFQGGELRLTNPGQLELLRAMMERGVPLRTMVRGFSMHPFIRDGDVLTISPVSGKNPSLGDVVAIIQPRTGRLAIHRIVGRMHSGLLIRGDNCPEADGVVNSAHILGRVTRIERRGRTVHAGLGYSGALIAALNNGDHLMRVKRFLNTPRRAASYALRSLQTITLYRQLGRRIAPETVIEEACENDMEEVHNRFNSRSLYRRQPDNSDVTNWVARRSRRVLGFVQLVYHPEEHYPWVGYWLFSLQVGGLYRGLGIGEELTWRVIGKAVELGAEKLFLVVYEDNLRAMTLYDKLGFEHTTLPGLEPQLLSEKQRIGRRRIVMQKKLR